MIACICIHDNIYSSSVLYICFYYKYLYSSGTFLYQSWNSEVQIGIGQMKIRYLYSEFIPSSFVLIRGI